MLRKKLMGAWTALVVLGFSASTFAGERLLKGQGDYVAETAVSWSTAGKGLLFVLGLFFIGFGLWQAFKNYVLATADHERKFHGGVIVVAIILGGLACYPFGAILIGQDAIGTTDVNVVQGDFDRSTGTAAPE